jgi:hypothetical protein
MAKHMRPGEVGMTRAGCMLLLLESAQQAMASS